MSAPPPAFQQRTFGAEGIGAWCLPLATMKGGDLDPAKALKLEVTVKIDRIQGEAGAFFQGFDDRHRYSLFFTETGVMCIGETENPTVKIDHSKPHTYTLVSPPDSNATQLLIDGELRLEYLAKSYSDLHGFNFGDGRSARGHGADALWLHVSCQQAKSLGDFDLKGKVVPVPSQEELEKLVAQLGHESYREREVASKALGALGLQRFKLLRSFLDHEDPEIKTRIRNLLGE